ncbi:alpha/beta hydrolase [Deinococcus pimensis]|uniref:alpha/beta hydrolase n=1 Tax=Deinococcus pimensis TaxID=309888 RepID=UPI0004B1D8D9|nr:alpha/beta hydrolase [Deinococcus pimensis]
MDSWDFGAGLHGLRVEPSGARAAVLLVHGYGEHSGRYAHVVDALAREGLAVFTYDHRGHGRSGGPRALLRLSELVDDHVTARAWLRRERPDLAVFALGHSLGGLVTATSVLRDPRGLAGVVLSSPALMVGHTEPAWRKRLARVLSGVLPGALVGRVEDGVLSRDPRSDEVFRADALNYSGPVKARSAYEMMAGGEAVLARLGSWRLPTLVIHGDADRLITIEGSRRFVAGITSEDRELWESPGGYHELFNDLEQEAAIRKVTDWISARVPAPASAR